MSGDTQANSSSQAVSGGMLFPPGLAVRRVRPIDNEAVRQLFIESQSGLATAETPREVRVALKRYTDSCLMSDLRRSSTYYSQAGKRLWLVESQERKIVAMAAVDSSEEAPGIAVLRRVCVTTDFRRKGLGKLLTRRAEQWAAKQGYSTIRLYVSELQPEAIGMYQKLEYAQTASESVGPIKIFVMEKPLRVDSAEQ